MGVVLKSIMGTKWVSGCLTLLLLVSATWSHAMVSGPCSNCHTMHNSQNAQVVSGTGPNPVLLNNDCVGCHSSSANSTFYEMGGAGGTKVPVVLFTGGNAPTEYLAGGNFYWVKEGLGADDTKGHNVFWNEPDQFLTKAPGSPNDCTNSCHVSLSGVYANYTLGFKGGCEGCHLGVAHHANDHPNGESGAVASGDQGWYRFLTGHFSDKGVAGYENGTWEAGLHDGNNHLGATNHNEYLGYVDPDGDSSGFASNGGLGKTTTAFCTGCHGLFHTGQKDGNAMWVRHPSDAVIPAEGEYNSVSSYDPLSPAARPLVPTTASSTVTPGTDMVMCLSCHRPHGSPYADMLRWDYSTQISGGSADAATGTGCFYCHTTKDD